MEAIHLSEMAPISASIQCCLLECNIFKTVSYAIADSISELNNICYVELIAQVYNLFIHRCEIVRSNKFYLSHKNCWIAHKVDEIYIKFE